MSGENGGAESFEARLRRVYRVMGSGEENPVQWFAGELGRTQQTVLNWINGDTDLPRYATLVLELMERLAATDAEKAKAETRELLEFIRSIKADFESTARGYYAKLEELEDRLERQVGEHHREEHFGDRAENESEARRLA